MLRRFDWGDVAEGAVGSAVIVIMSPGFGYPQGFREASEPVLVQALILEEPVEALAGAVRDGFSGWRKWCRILRW